MQITNFMGGINNILAAHLLQNTECQELVNCDISTGIIKSFNSLKQIDNAEDDVVVYNAGKATFLPTKTITTTIGDIVYATNTKGCVQKIFTDGSKYNLIIEGPISALEVKSNTTSGEIIGNNIKYCYTYYGSKDGAESAPSPFSANVVIGNGSTDKGQVQLNGILASSDPQVTHINIYRIGNTLTEYSLIMQLPNQNGSVIDGNGDSTATTKLTTYGYNLTLDKSSGPYETTYITNYDGSLFTVCSNNNNNNKVYFSVSGRPDLWGEGYILLDEEVITVSPVSVGLIIACKTKTYICYGNTGNFTKQLLLPSVGCSGKSMLGTPIGVIWFYNGTIWNFYQAVTELSKLRLKVEGEVISCCANEACGYFLLDTGKILVINYALGLKFYYLEATGIKSITIANGNLILNDGSKLYTLTGESSKFKVITKKYIEKALTMYKNYKTIYIYAKGDINCKVYIDENLVAETKLLQGLTEVKVDQTKRTGYYIWFEFEGIGSIYELQWIVEGRQNGR